jgi:hypothetical protein
VVRAAVWILVLVGVVLGVSAWRGAPVPVPWAPSCVVVDASGEALRTGSPDEVAAAVVEPDQALAEALSAGPAVSCRIAPIRGTGEAKEPPHGLTPRAQVLRAEVRDVFGPIPDGGYGPEETLPGRSPRGEHSQGRAIDYFFRPPEDPEQARAGWELANWAVANAERLGIRTVIYRDRIWTAWRSAQGWRDYRFSGSDPDNPINRHLDHVHLDVA